MSVRLLRQGVLALAVAGVTLACASEPADPTPEATAALSNANITGVEAEWDADADVLHLRGTVDSDAVKTRAEEVVSDAVDASARVMNEIEVEEPGLSAEQRDEIRMALETRYSELVESSPVWKDREIEFSVDEDGVVTIRGTVPTAEQKDQLDNMAQGLANVTDVVNEVEVVPTT